MTYKSEMGLKENGKVLKRGGRTEAGPEAEEIPHFRPFQGLTGTTQTVWKKTLTVTHIFV